MVGEMAIPHPGQTSYGARAIAFGDAQWLYRRQRMKAYLTRIAGWLTRRPTSLLSLTTTLANHPVEAQRFAGTQSVLIREITGSESRSRDFDNHFQPLQLHTMQRWLRLAMARLQGKSMPPVILIKVGDNYYVRDGHHRISVARALGEQFVDAEVTVWQIAR